MTKVCIFYFVSGQFSSWCTSAVTSDHYAQLFFECFTCFCMCKVLLMWRQLQVYFSNSLQLLPSYQLRSRIIFMPLIFENTNPIQDYACTFSAHQKAILKNLRKLWDSGLCITLATIFLNNKGLKSVYTWSVLMASSINGTLQAYKVLPLIYSQVGYQVFGVV